MNTFEHSFPVAAYTAHLEQKTVQDPDRTSEHIEKLSRVEGALEKRVACAIRFYG